MGTRGVWSLENVELKKPQDDWVPLPNVFVDGQVPAPNFAYVGGGSNPNYDKMDLSNDTRLYGQYSWEWSPSSSGRAQHYCASTGGGSHGYWSGGGGSLPSPNWSSAVDKRTFAPGTTDAVALENPSSNLTIGRACHKGISAPSHGYFVGGAKGSPASDLLSAVDKITNATDTVSRVPGADLPSVNHRKHMLATTGNSSVGYILGGVSPISSASAKISFATDSTSQSPGSNAIIARSYNNGSSSGTACYWFGGVTIPGISVPFSTSNSTSNFEKTTIATDTNSSVGNVPDQGLQQMAVTGNETAAYTFGSGGPSSGTGAGSNKMPYSNETMSNNPGTNLYSGKSASSAFCPRNGGITDFPTGSKERWADGVGEPPNTAYAASGTNGPSPVYKTNLSTLTAFAYLSPATQSPQRTRQGTFSSGFAAYMNGGATGVPQSTMVSNTDKLTYSTDTTARLPGSNSPVVLFGHNGIANETSGWFWGGHTYGIPEPYNQTNLYKTTFSTDAMSTSPATMTAGNYYMSSTNSATAGYTFSGQTYSTNTQKMTFSTESCSMLPAQVPSAIYNNGSAIGNQTAGYVNAGHPAYSAIVKTVWTTETSSQVASITSPGRSKTLCFGNTTLGFWGGGTPGPAATVDQITYATDTVANVPGWEPSAIGGPSQFGWGEGGRSRGIPIASPPAATPTATTMTKFPATLSNFGYQQGGSGSDEVRKIDFSTEVGSEIPARLPNIRYDHCTFTSNLASYISGGSTPSSTNSSQIDKTVYATGTSSNVVNGSSDNLEPGRRRSGAAGNTTNGWTLGGSPAKSRIDKFFYSSETNQGDGYWSNDGPGPNGRNWFSTLSAPEYIYAAGGQARSNFWRFTYGISSQQEVPGATLVRTPGSPNSYGAEGQIAGLGNKIQGYVGGGKNPGATGGSNPFMQKFVYATETASSLGEILTGSRYGVSNCGDLETGYFLGGSDAGSTGTGKTTKITYSSDTYAVCPAADTASQKQRGQGSGAKSFGIHTSSFPIVI